MVIPVINVENLTALVLLCSLLIIIYIHRKPQTFPPGYTGFPVIGVIPFLSRKNPAKTFYDWSKKLGPIIHVRMGLEDWIVLNDYDSVNKYLVKHGKQIAGRPPCRLYNDGRQGKGIVFKDDAAEIRKVLVNEFRSFNGSESSFEIIQREVDHLNEKIVQQKDKVVDIQFYLSRAIANILFMVMTGRRFNYDHPVMRRHLNEMHDIFNDIQNSSYIMALTMFYSLRVLPVFRRVKEKMCHAFLTNFNLHKILLKQKQRESTKGTKECFRDNLLKNFKSEKLDQETEDELVAVVQDFCSAGFDTTLSTLRWSFLYLAKNQQVQSTIYEEITKFKGDRQSMYLTCSFIDEMMRYKTVAPLSVFHKVTQQVNIDGVRLKPGTTVVSNTWAVHRDQTYFTEPKKFTVDRFLNKESGVYEKSKCLIPFGIGRRLCLGNKLGYASVFTILCGVLQKFKVLENEKHPLPDFEDPGIFATISYPKPYLLKIELR